MNHQIIYWLSVVTVVLTLIVLAVQMLTIRKFKLTGRSKIFLLFGVGLFPLLSLYISNESLLEQMKEVEFCGSCHIMTHFVNSLEDPEVETLASRHVQRHRIKEWSCYTCHTDYDLLGGVRAKFRGLKHIYHYYIEPSNKRPHLYNPFPNQQCLSCHAGARNFEAGSEHQELAVEIKSNEISCLDCHGPAHPEYEEME